MTTFFGISTLALGALSIYLIKLILREREYQLDVLSSNRAVTEPLYCVQLQHHALPARYGEVQKVIHKLFA